MGPEVDHVAPVDVVLRSGGGDERLLPDNTPEQIEEVKNQIRRDHDVVTLRITRIKKLITLP